MEDATADGGCPSQATQTLATKITFTVGWPTSSAGSAGTGPVSIWLLTTFTGDSTLTGTTQSCGLTLPDLDLNQTGQTVTGGTKIQIQVTDATWDSIKRTSPVTGTQTGWNIGSMQSTSPAVVLLGLLGTGTYASDMTAWPANCATGKCASSPPVMCTGGGTATGGTCTGMYAGPFAGSDLTDDDGDGFPGITANPLQANGYVLPPTGYGSLKPGSVAPADQVYIVSRNEMTLTNMRATDCTHMTGTAKITLFDNHVVGCHGGAWTYNGTMHPAAACTSDQVGFLDSNRTIYGYDQTKGDTISSAHPVMGTAKVVALSAGANCSGVRGANFQ